MQLQEVFARATAANSIGGSLTRQCLASGAWLLCLWIFRLADYVWKGAMLGTRRCLPMPYSHFLENVYGYLLTKVT